MKILDDRPYEFGDFIDTAKLPCKVAVLPLFTFIPAASKRMSSPCCYHLLTPFCVTCSSLMSEKWYLGVAHVSRIILKTWHHFLPWVAVAVFSLHLFCLWLALRAGCCLFGPWVSAVASLLSLSLSLFLAICQFFPPEVYSAQV